MNRTLAVFSFLVPFSLVAHALFVDVVGNPDKNAEDGVEIHGATKVRCTSSTEWNFKCTD